MEQMFPIPKALEKFSDPELFARFDKAARTCCAQGWLVHRFDSAPVLHIGGAPPGYREAIVQWENAREPVIGAFLRALRSGDLAAVGFHHPVTPESSEVSIAASQWSFLEPLFSTAESVASGGGLRFVGVRVGRRSALSSMNQTDAGKPGGAGWVISADLNRPQSDTAGAPLPRPVVLQPEAMSQTRRKQRTAKKKAMYEQWRALVPKYRQKDGESKRSRRELVNKIAADPQAKDPTTGKQPNSDTVRRTLDRFFRGWAEKS